MEVTARVPCPWLGSSSRLRINSTRNALEGCYDLPQFGTIVPSFEPNTRTLHLLSISTGTALGVPIFGVGPAQATSCLKTAWAPGCAKLALLFDFCISIIDFNSQTLHMISEKVFTLPDKCKGSQIILLKWTTHDSLVIALPSHFLIYTPSTQSFGAHSHSNIREVAVSTEGAGRISTVAIEAGSLLIRHPTGVKKVLLGQSIRSTHYTAFEELVCLHQEPEKVVSIDIDMPEISPLHSLMDIRSLIQPVASQTILAGTILKPSTDTSIHTAYWPKELHNPSNPKHSILTRNGYVAFSDATSSYVFVWRPSVASDKMDIVEYRFEARETRVLGLLSGAEPDTFYALVGDHKHDSVGLALPSKVEYIDVSFVTFKLSPSYSAEDSEVDDFNYMPHLHSPLPQPPHIPAHPNLCDHRTDHTQSAILAKVLETVQSLDAKMNSLITAQTRLEQRVDQIVESMASRK